jgi:hypothetical protein
LQCFVLPILARPSGFGVSGTDITLEDGVLQGKLILARGIGTAALSFASFHFFKVKLR